MEEACSGFIPLGIIQRHLLAGKSGISIISNLKEVSVWLFELFATPKEWLDLFVPRQAARTARKPCCEKTKG
jgi:hypothetical protein